MSIEAPLAPTTSKSTAKMASEKVSSKGEKKHKSSHSEKKRKRDAKEDGHKSKSKKLKADKLVAAPEAEAEVEIASPANDSHENSPFHVQTFSLYLPLAPVSQKFPLEGLCAEHLSPLILTYYPPFAGVILAYDNPRFSEKAFGNDGANGALLKNVDEYAVSWAWVTAEFLLFKTDKGTELEGYVNYQNEGHLGVVCWNMFNAAIDRSRLPADWKWVSVGELEAEEGAEDNYAEDGSGYYVDGEGKKIEGNVKFRVKEIEANHDRERGFLNISGTMLGWDEEAALAEKERTAAPTTKSPTSKRLWPSKAVGGTSLGVPADPDEMDGDSGKRKHRHRY
ncbi:hypothetical protein HYFRA_00014047 [Hymenoscyphus fraxineus]|uniref:DNA-directed RNA polymerase subunit n=1 Tax=Hymenoscyphus fraxineus TaxID=746836 RepID=A0A9N9LDA1_9HELO|nr:hypothetical protein HYFRA_00014047 [Hymenoscyphus fraxineus]